MTGFELKILEYCKNVPKPQTNFQRITQSEETLAEWLGENVDYCRTMWYWACDKCDWSKKHESCMNDKEKWLEWLKQESDTE